MKNEPGPDMVILGSGSIVSQLAQAGLIDEYQVALSPIVLGKGRSMFEGVKQNVNPEKDAGVRQRKSHAVVRAGGVSESEIRGEPGSSSEGYARARDLILGQRS